MLRDLTNTLGTFTLLNPSVDRRIYMAVAGVRKIEPPEIQKAALKSVARLEKGLTTGMTPITGCTVSSCLTESILVLSRSHKLFGFLKLICWLVSSEPF